MGGGERGREAMNGSWKKFWLRTLGVEQKDNRKGGGGSILVSKSLPVQGLFVSTDCFVFGICLVTSDTAHKNCIVNENTHCQLG